MNLHSPSLTSLAVLMVGCVATATLLADTDEEVSVRGIFGVERFLSDFQGPTTQATVMVFLDPDCPVVQQYVPRLRELYDRYNRVDRDRAGRPVIRVPGKSPELYKYPGDRVCFLGVYATPGISLKEIAGHALDRGIPFRVVQDLRQEVMRKYQVTELAEVVVLDSSRGLLYQGTIDDQFYPGGAKTAAGEHYLRDVLDGHLSGQNPAVVKRPPQGCIISQIKPDRGYPQVTFHEQVQPILQKNCQTCHHNGAVGPMSLVTYAEVDRYAEMIEEVVMDRRMPPWPGKSPHRLKDDVSLNRDEIETLVAWVRGGRKRGDPTKAPPAPTWDQKDHWKIGSPDIVFEMPRAHKVPASGLINYVYYPLPAGFSEDRYIKSIETRPGSPEVVHHIQVHEYHGDIKDATAGLSALEQLMVYGTSLDEAKLLGSYTPGNQTNARMYGKHRGMKLERGANLILELHYTPNGQATADRSRVGVIFTDEKPKREILTHYYLRKRGDFVIPANTQHHSMQQLYHFEKPVRILSIRPHMHARAKSFRLELVDSAQVRMPDIHNRDTHLNNKGEVLLTIPIWDFNWQRTYEFEEPVVVSSGQALLGTAFWDNSKYNPRNPDSDQDVPWGQQITQEMFNILFLYEEL